MTVAAGPVAIPDSTGPTYALLRELRRGRARKQAASIAFWIYLALFIVAVWGGSLIVAAYRALRHPPPPSGVSLRVLHALPAGLAALAVLVLLLLVRDALWRGPVTVPGATVDWLLGTPVDRRRLLRPRFRLSAAGAIAAGAAVGIVPAAALVALGLGGRDGGDVLRLTGAGMLSAALLFAAGTGLAGLVERNQASWPWVRRATPVALAAAALLAGIAAWAAFGMLPSVVNTVLLWSGPWGWTAQGLTAQAGHGAPPALTLSSPGYGAFVLRAGIPAGSGAPWWPLATALLAAVALAALAAGQRAAAGVPAAALRARARTLGAMSAAAASMNTRGVATAYGAAGSRPRRARLRLPAPRRRSLVLVWRDLLALARAPARLAAAVALAWLAAGLIAAASHGRQVSLLPVGCALILGYLAAAWLCEGARLDADDPRRSAQLPFRFESLAWRHAVVPVLLLLGAAGLPVAAACLATGDPRPLALLAVTVPVLVAGALVNVFRPPLTPDMFIGAETPIGNTAVINIVFWYAWGTLLAVVPMTVLLSDAIRSPGPGSLARAVIIGALLAAGLGAYAARRARRLQAG
jgi:Family of unknown function (DUF6297)